MSEMIDRGIDALIANFKATVEANCKMFGVNQTFEETKVQVPSRSALRPMVVAMIEALREPTELMVKAGARVDSEYANDEDTADQWRAMIDAILDETPKP